jgi:hypothetical protein
VERIKNKEIRMLVKEEGSIIDAIAKIAPAEYEAYIASLSREQFTNYIEYVISFILAAVGAGIQLRQKQLEDAALAAGNQKPDALLLAPEALERFTDHFRRRFGILLPKDKYQINEKMKTYLWDKGMMLGANARSLADRDKTSTVDLNSLDEALAAISQRAIVLTERFNRINNPITPLEPVCDPIGN